jgi:hypothetical protein
LVYETVLRQLPAWTFPALRWPDRSAGECGLMPVVDQHVEVACKRHPCIYVIPREPK